MKHHTIDVSKCTREDKEVVEGLCLSFDMVKGLCLETMLECMAFTECIDDSDS